MDVVEQTRRDLDDAKALVVNDRSPIPAMREFSPEYMESFEKVRAAMPDSSYAYSRPVMKFPAAENSGYRQPVVLAPGGYGDTPEARKATAVSDELRYKYTGNAEHGYRYTGNFFRNTDTNVPLGDYGINQSGVQVPVGSIRSMEDAMVAGNYLVATHGADGKLLGRDAESLANEIYGHALGDRAGISSAAIADVDSGHSGDGLRGAWDALGKVGRVANVVTGGRSAADIETQRVRSASMQKALAGSAAELEKFNEDLERRPSASVSVRQDAKGGEDRFSVSRNFLATDEVPDTIFGIPVVARKEDYTEADLKFFAEHPEAGGYYDLGDEETPEDGSSEGAPVQADEAGEFMRRNPTLFKHVKSFEKLRLAPYPDIGGYAIGYGAHTDADGKPVTALTAALKDEAAAAALLARDLYARREKLKATLPGWDYMPGGAKQALLDVSMGKNGILSKDESKGLHADLTAAGNDPAKLLAAVKKHYYSYLTDNPEHREGLIARRVAGGKLFFGEDFSYEGKTWDPKLGFTTKGVSQ